MNTASCHRGDPSLYLERNPAWKIDRGAEGGVRGLPPRSLPSQTREGFYAKQALGAIAAGKKAIPTKLETISAQGLAVKSAAPLAVKPATSMKK